MGVRAQRRVDVGLRQHAQVVRVQRTEHAPAGEGDGAVEDRQRGQPDTRAERRAAQHLEQVAGEAEAGDVGHRAHAVFAQAARGGTVRLRHRAERRAEARPARQRAHVRRQQHAGAERLGQDERVARRGATLAQQFTRARMAVHREAERKLRAFAGMAADERRVFLVEQRNGAGKKQRQFLAHLAGAGVGQGHERKRRLGLGAHREDVPEAVIRRDAPEQPGVVDEAAELVDRLHRERAGWQRDDGRVVRGVEADQHVLAHAGAQPVERAAQRLGAELGAAAAAAHRVDLRGADRSGQRARHRVSRHRERLRIALDEAPVDPVLPAPHPVAGDREAPARCNRVRAAGADETQRLALRPEALEPATEQRGAEVRGEPRPLAHRVNACLRTRIRIDVRDVAGGEHFGMRDRAQAGVDPDETVAGRRETRRRRPRRRGRVRDPQDFVERDPRAARGEYARRIDRGDAAIEMKLDARVAQRRAIEPARASGVAGQDVRGGRHQVEAQPVRIRAGPREFAAQAMAHGHQQFDSACAAADDADAQRPARRQHALAQAFPARVETADRLDRNRVLRGALRIQRRRGAGVDAQPVVGDRRSGPQQHPPVRQVEPDDFVLVQPGVRGARERGEIDVRLVEAVVARDQARQHAGVGCLDFATDDGQAHPRQRLHREAADDLDVRVAAAQQDEVDVDRARVHLGIRLPVQGKGRRGGSSAPARADYRSAPRRGHVWRGSPLLKSGRAPLDPGARPARSRPPPARRKSKEVPHARAIAVST